MEHWKAEVVVNGPHGTAHAEVETEQDGSITTYNAEAAITQALQIYNALKDTKAG